MCSFSILVGGGRLRIRSREFIPRRFGIKPKLPRAGFEPAIPHGQWIFGWERRFCPSIILSLPIKRLSFNVKAARSPSCIPFHHLGKMWCQMRLHNNTPPALRQRAGSVLSANFRQTAGAKRETVGIVIYCTAWCGIIADKGRAAFTGWLF